MDNTPMNMQDYEQTYNSFRLDVPEFYNFAFDVVDKWAEDRTKLALLTVDSDGNSADRHSFWGPQGPVKPLRQHPTGPRD